MQIFIASVEWLLIANIGRFVMARSLLRRRGHLGFCHYERSEVIQKQVLLAKRLPRRAFCTARNDKLRIVIANVVWRSTSKEIASVTTFHRNDNFRDVMARGLVPRGHLLASRLLPPRHKCGSWQAHI